MLGCEAIRRVFEAEFRDSYRVELRGGAVEPVYLPAKNPEEYHQLVYTRDYPASALHEIAHWCLASEERLGMQDWGLWYVPDGRSAVQQERFQRVEARVQALEWILSMAAGRPFRESSDNLSGEYLDDTAFKLAIYREVLGFCERGLPERAARLFQAFARARDTSMKLGAGMFSPEVLGLEKVYAQ